ncbi:hypothetical protein KSS87_017869 [Heliosperma pusillum]|nr:hypothetical protein KSS87_017869 [Heliosperma pusillum]
MASKTEHIILLPFMAQGHLRPFLHLALSLSSRTRYTITLLTTPLNAEKLRENLNSITTTTAKINDILISELPFNGEDYNLPPNVENTEKLPLTLIINLFHSSTSLEPHLESFLTRHIACHHRPPVAIIFDNFLGWADRVARKFNSTGIAFSTCGAYGTAAYSSVWGNLPHRNTNEKEFCVPGFPENRRFRRDQLHPFIRNADGTDAWSRFFQPQISMSMQSSGWLVNSVEEVEPLGFDILRNYLKLPVWAVGPLISSPMSLSDDKCIKWLNIKAKDSVLYISFGSQNTINPTQMMELAAGLEMSGKPFLWLIRPPYGFDINGDFEPEWLPDGFEDRVMISGQGMMVHKWGPQLEILSHEAVGGFLSHCGWNSVLEGLGEGVPIIGWPLAAEQAYNLKMMVEEMGVAVELARGVDGEVGREKVKTVVETVLDRAEGSVGWEMKRVAVDVRSKLRGALEAGEVVKGSSVKGMDDFVEFVESKRVTVNFEKKPFIFDIEASSSLSFLACVLCFSNYGKNAYTLWHCIILSLLLAKDYRLIPTSEALGYCCCLATRSILFMINEFSTHVYGLSELYGVSISQENGFVAHLQPRLKLQDISGEILSWSYSTSLCACVAVCMNFCTGLLDIFLENSNEE